MVVFKKDRIEIKSLVDASLNELIKSQPKNLHRLLNDALFPGRRMRPALLYMLLGKKYLQGKYVPIFLALELVHRSSIILDDLIDGDYERRGLPAFHIQHGRNATLLVSNFINSLVYRNLEEFKKNTNIDLISDFTSCYSDMVVGEMADINVIKSEDSYLDFYKSTSLKKTNALFVLLMKVFFSIKYPNGFSENFQVLLGESFGNIYQIQNDVYDDLYSSFNERGQKAEYVSALTLAKAIVMDEGKDNEKNFLTTTLGNSLTSSELHEMREILSSQIYMSKITSLVNEQKQMLSSCINKLNQFERTVFQDFIDWLESRYCWNHKEYENAGY